jgi:glucose uptake protein
MGYIPPVSIAYFMSFLTMLGWGSWSVTQRRCGNWRFEAWYIDYSWSIVAGTFIIGMLLGGVSPSGWNFQQYWQMLTDIKQSALMWALFAGIVWGAGNFLLAAAIRLAGLALAFPIGIGLSLALGTMLAYITDRSATAHPVFLFAGLVLIVLAIICNGLAHATKHAHTPTANLKRGVIVAIICGVLIALFPFPFNFAFKAGLSGEAGAFYMTIGALLINIILVPYFMRHPLVPSDKPSSLREYSRAKPAWHAWAALGGLIWSVGMVCNLVVANQPKFSVAIAYTFGQCAAMIAALWGIFGWKEFKGAPGKAHAYLGLMFALFLSGILLLAQATG